MLLQLRRWAVRQIAPLHLGFDIWAEAFPRSTRARRRLNDLDRKKLAELLADPGLADARDELRRLEPTGTAGGFEQEGLLPLSAVFPFVG